MKKIIQSAVHFLCFFAFWTAQSQSCPNSDNVPELDGSVCITTKAPLNYQEGDEDIYLGDIEDCELIGDLNDDDVLNVLDVILLVNAILYQTEYACSDLNGDNILNISDVVILIGIILE